MNNQEKSALLVELVNNEEVITKISNAESKEDMQAIFAANGLEMSLAEIDAFIQMMNSEKEGELDEGDLENVAGGVDALWIFSTAWKGIKAVAKGAWNAGKWLAKNGF